MAQNAGTFYLIEDVPKFTKFMSEPIKMQPGNSPLNTPGYFLAGIIKGYLFSAGFGTECALTCPLSQQRVSVARIYHNAFFYLSPLLLPRPSTQCLCS
jgi:hypothetical protein